MQLFSNVASTTLANSGGVGIGDTLLELPVGDGAKFAAISLPSSDYELLTLIGGGQWEVVKVVQRSGDNLTVVRAYEGVGRAWPEGTRIVSSITKEALERLSAGSGVAARIFMYRHYR